jgi:hypothetical protein
VNIRPIQLTAVSSGEEGILYVPSSKQTDTNALVINGKESARFRKASTESTNIYEMIIGCIVLLLKLCRPSAIRWLVISICIFSFNGVGLAWASPHVLKEAFKFKPPLANLYSSTSIAMEIVKFRIATPSDHCSPSSVSLLEPLSPPCCAMSCAFLFTANSTGFASPRLQVDYPNWFLSAAITATEHPFDGVSVFSGGWFTNRNYRELAKTLADERTFVRHDDDSLELIIVFSGGNGLQPILTATPFSPFHQVSQRPDSTERLLNA